MTDDAEARLGVAADRFEVLIGRMEATARRECDCSLAGLRRENERLLGLLRAHPPPRPTAETRGGTGVVLRDLWADAERSVSCGPSRAVE